MVSLRLHPSILERERDVDEREKRRAYSVSMITFLGAILVRAIGNIYEMKYA